MADKESGFRYSVTLEQIRGHKQKSVKEVLQWLGDTYRLIYTFQTDKERNARFLFKGKKYGIYTPKITS